jgi:hypothetical protein
MMVYMDVMDIPVEPCPREAKAKKNRGSKADITRAHNKTGRIVPVIGGVGRVPPWAIYREGIVERHMDNLRVRRFDPDDLLLDDHLLLFCRLEITLLLGLAAQILNGGHDLILLAQKGISQLPRLIQFLTHGKEDIREITERFYAGVPRLLLQGITQGITF